MPRRIRICAVDELRPGTRRVVEIDAYEEALVLNLAGTVYAISNICPHEGAALERGSITGTVLYCPLHRWGFELTTGGALDEAGMCAPVYAVEQQDNAFFLLLPPSTRAGAT